MRYSMSIDTAKTTSPFLNVRLSPSITGVDVGNFLVGSIAEGDELVTGADGNQWLKVLMIDNIPQDMPDKFITTVYCKVTENTAPPLDAPDFVTAITVLPDGTAEAVFSVRGVEKYRMIFPFATPPIG